MKNDLTSEESSYALVRAVGFYAQLNAQNPKSVYLYICALACELFIDIDYQKKDNLLINPSQLQALIDELILSHNITAFAEKFLTLKPFARGNSLILRKFCVELAKSPAFKKAYPNGIDFRRVPLKNFDHYSIAQMLEFSAKAGGEKTIRCRKWPKLASSEMSVKGYRFLAYKKKYFVTLRGGIIAHADILEQLEQFLASGGHPNDFVFPAQLISRYISGEAIDELKQDRLFCLDLDYFTGLIIKNELPTFSQEISKQKVSALTVPDSQLTHPLVRKAAPRIAELKGLILNKAQDFFQDKQPSLDATPKFIMSMGGIGSGKSHLDEYAENITHHNCIFASVDLARQASRLLELYQICHHHSDDYQSLALFSYVVMGEIASRTLKGGYNYFRDSTGIPYKGRNEDYIKIHKLLGYETNIIGANAPLYIMPDRHDLFEPIHERIIARLKKHQRAVPWDIVVKKNIAYPLEQMHAAHDILLDKLVIYDTMGKKGHAYPLAQTFSITAAQLNQLMLAENDKENLLATLKEFAILPFPEKPDMLLNPQAICVKVMAELKGGYKILVIVDNLRMLDVIQKGLLNLNAKGYEALLYNCHPFHIPALDFPHDGRGEKDSYKLRLQKNSTLKS